jgi:hypothetical protein
MIGLYYLPTILIEHETGLSQEDIKLSIHELSATGIISYDSTAEQIYVKPTVLDQVGINLDPNDKRITLIQRLYNQAIASPTTERFFEDHGARYHLVRRNDPTRKQQEIGKKVPEKSLPVQTKMHPTATIPECKDSSVDKKNQKIDENSEIRRLLKRYDDSQESRIEILFSKIAMTRKSMKMAPSVILSILKQFDKVEIARVMYATELYLSKQYYLEGRGERYLLGIMHRATAAEINKPRIVPKVNGAQETPTTTNNVGVLKRWIDNGE